jgi:ubiquinone/menaquinone biosynthesis C-methylase UbiE
MDIVTEKNEKAYDAFANKWQAALSRGATDFAQNYLEKPAMVTQMPCTLFGKKVLCIGVGAGNELKEILKRQPDKVVGIDVSTKLLNIAKSRFPQVEFQRMDMTQMTFGNEEFDFVYSSLVFHYAKDWDVLLAGVNTALKKGGKLLFSTHHPARWGRKTPTGNSYTNQRGVTLTGYNAVLPDHPVEITYYNHVNKEAIIEALEYARSEVKHAFAPSVILTDFSPKFAHQYEWVKANNTNTPLFFIVSAIKK